MGYIYVHRKRNKIHNKIIQSTNIKIAFHTNSTVKNQVTLQQLQQ
jgi:hypothetical protein